MAISSLGPQKSSNLPKILMIVLALVGLGLLLYFGRGVLQGLGNLGGKSGLSVTTHNGSSEVYINNNLVGTTPLEIKTVKPGENKVTLKSGSKRYESTFTFIPNWHVVVIRDLGTSDVFSSGQNTWMEQSAEGSMLSVISEPAGASVYIDSTEIGKTPYSSTQLTEGEYDLRISYPGYEEESGRVKISKGHKLNISAKLFPTPVKSRVDLLDGSDALYNVSSDNSLIFSDTQSWVNAIIYWNQTRGINVGGAGINKEKVFDYYLDYQGLVYNKEGAPLMNPSDYAPLKDSKKGAYLGRVSDSAGLTDAAKKTLALITDSTTATTTTTTTPGSTVTPTPTGTPAPTSTTTSTSGKTATINTTETGWLRVRNAAGLNGTEIAKVNTGEKYAVLEVGTGWVKIKVSDTIQGWVSADYVTVQ